MNIEIKEIIADSESILENLPNLATLSGRDVILAKKQNLFNELINCLISLIGSEFYNLCILF